jgi:hypothetical protein
MRCVDGDHLRCDGFGRTIRDPCGCDCHHLEGLEPDMAFPFPLRRVQRFVDVHGEGPISIVIDGQGAAVPLHAQDLAAVVERLEALAEAAAQ